LRRHCSYLITIALWITVAASPTGAQKRYDPGANDTEIKIGRTNSYGAPRSSFGTIGRTIAVYDCIVNGLATFPWHRGVSSVAPKRMTIARLTLAQAAALAAGLPTTSYQPA
jgi:hypothetical protein